MKEKILDLIETLEFRVAGQKEKLAVLKETRLSLEREQSVSYMAGLEVLLNGLIEEETDKSTLN